ncbi:site-specific integrase [Bacteroides sp. 224]|uniref:tyrosine-type recombinase/integrase n=1 Tax=Bacteroides sp. 224 TaxID=2302936 RepID=UPI0013D20ABD|nr:site-specific integrase [Bacteroides sp. 224]NDV66425.1 hypothetical protein [Bacteroides sp. 224]
MLLFTLVDLRSKERLRNGRYRTSRAYRSTFNSVKSYCLCDITLEKCFTKKFLVSYQQFLENRGLSLSTISFYMRMLRALYNYAVDCEYVSFTPKLFACVYTGTGKTVKRAVSADSIRKLNEQMFSEGSALDKSRDLFLFSLYAQGISFVDMAFLMKNNLSGDTLTYHRRKTGTSITVSLIPEAQAILKKYASRVSDSPYLLPIITSTSSQRAYTQYESALHLHNHHLKQIGRLSGMENKLTSYVARHSWATIAYHSGVDVAVISQAMGHRTEEVTRIYLASFSVETLMKANSLVMSKLSGSC